MKHYLLLICLIHFLTFSQENSGFQILLTHENDFLFINNNDENYTGGLNLELTTSKWSIWQPFIRLSPDNNYQKISIMLLINNYFVYVFLQ